MDQLIASIDNQLPYPCRIPELARAYLGKQVSELTPQDILYLLAILEYTDSLPTSMHAARILEFQAEARNNKLCAEIAKLTALIEQRLPTAVATPAETPVDISVDAPVDAPDPAVNTPAAATPQLSPVYTEWVAQNIHLVKETYAKIWSDDQENRFVCEYLATKGLLDILKEAPPTENLELFAAVGGSLCVIEWLVESGRQISGYELFRNAVVNGHINILEYMCKTFPEADFIASHNYCAVELAARTGRLQVIKWFASIGKMDANAIHICAEQAAAEGHLDIVKYVFRTYSISPRKAARKAAIAGHLPIVQLLSANGLIGRAAVPKLITISDQQPHVVAWLREMYE